MGIVVDVVLVLILVLNIIIGYKKGLIKVAFSIFAFFIAIVISLILFKPVSMVVINNTEIDDKIRQIILSANSYEEELENKQENNKNNKETFIQKYIEEKVAQTGREIKKNAIESIAESISIKATEIITGLILFVVIRIALIFVRFITEILANLPIIKQFNEIGGLIYGCAKGILIIYLLLTIIFIVSSMKGNNTVSEAISNSYITKFLYESNPIIKSCLLDKNLL